MKPPAQGFLRELSLRSNLHTADAAILRVT